MHMNFSYASLRVCLPTLFGSKTSVTSPFSIALAWLWSWYLGPVLTFTSFPKNKAFHIAFLYGIANEMLQAFIPDRFPFPWRPDHELGGSLTRLKHTLHSLPKPRQTKTESKLISPHRLFSLQEGRMGIMKTGHDRMR